MGRCSALISLIVIGFLLLQTDKENGADAAPAPQQQRVISVTSEHEVGGSTRVTITAVKIKDTGVLIRVVPSWSSAECNPQQSVLPGLDLRDSYSSERDISPSISGAWSLADASDGSRGYSALMSPARLRQQFIGFSHINQHAASIGAVTGGSVGAIVYACVYKVSNGAINVIGESSVVFVSQSSENEAHIDMSAMIMSKVIVTGTGQQRTASVAMKVRTHTTCFDSSEINIDPSSIPAPIHVSSVAYGITLDTTEGKSAARGRSGLCEEVEILGENCRACIRNFYVTSPVEVTYPEQIIQQLDVVSRFTAAKSTDAAATPFAVRFIIPTTSICYSEDGTTCGESNQGVRTLARGVTSAPSPVQVSVSSGGKVTSATQLARGDGVSQTATVYNGDTACIGIGTAENGEAVSALKTVVINPCDTSKGDCSGTTSALALVTGGSINSDLARFSSGTIKKEDNGVSLCFSSNIGTGQRLVSVTWLGQQQKTTEEVQKVAVKEDVPKAKTAVNGWGMPQIAREDNHPPHHQTNENEDENHHRPHEEDDNEHVITIDVAFVCGHDTHFDRERGRCMDDHEGNGSWWLQFFIFVVVIIVVICIIICVSISFEEDVSHDEHHHSNEAIHNVAMYTSKHTHYK